VVVLAVVPLRVEVLEVVLVEVLEVVALVVAVPVEVGKLTIKIL
jgi:hypothetical protein